MFLADVFCGHQQHLSTKESSRRGVADVVVVDDDVGQVMSLINISSSCVQIVLLKLHNDNNNIELLLWNS